MASKYQKKSFPLDELGKMKTLTVYTERTKEFVDINYSELKLIYANGQLCFYYESSDGNLIIPICRKSTFDKLMEE